MFAVTESQFLAAITVLACVAIPTLFWLLIREKDHRRRDAIDTLQKVLEFKAVLELRNEIADRMLEHTESLIAAVTRLEDGEEAA